MVTHAPERPSAHPFVPATRSVRRLRDEALSCQGCALYRAATQTVFGSGRQTARLMLVGEQPGDLEDRRGRPFVGPAGRMLWKCLEAADVPHDDLYVTNAVKHFKFDQRGKRRIHHRPNAAEIDACQPWLSAELDAVRPTMVVALGAVAARSLLGRPAPVEASRGTVQRTADGRPVIVTYHPSALLRADDPEPMETALVGDLAWAWRRACGADDDELEASGT